MGDEMIWQALGTLIGAGLLCGALILAAAKRHKASHERAE